MRRRLTLLMPLVLTFVACDSGGEGGGRNESITSLSGNPVTGEMVFSNNTCSSDACHGADGNSGMAPALRDAVPGATDDAIIDSVLDGTGAMPPQALEDQEMADVLAWMRATF